MNFLFLDMAIRPSGVFGGQERFIMEFSNFLISKGNKVYFILRQESFLTEHLTKTASEFKIIKINKYSLNQSLESILNFIHDKKIEILITLDSLGNRIAFKTKKKKPLLKLYAFRFDVYLSRFMGLRMKALKRLYRRLDIAAFKYFEKVFCISDEIRAELETFVENSKLVLFKPIIDESVIGNSEKKSQEENILQILSGGRFEENKKGFSVLIKALNLLLDKGERNFHLTLFGDGPDMKLYKKLSTKLQKNNLIDFPGFVKNPGELYAHSDVFVLTSRYEGYPFVVLEAMANDCIVISTPIPELQKQFSQGNILFFNFNDSRELYKILKSKLLNLRKPNKNNLNSINLFKEFSKEIIFPDIYKDLF